ncbi:MAG: hypothetical protein ACE5HT_03735 [Gemmatimonadales bacterium]
MRRVIGLLAVLALALPRPATAQNSLFGVLGIGFPGRPDGVRSRALGGGYGVLDARSGVNPAAIVGFRSLTAALNFGTTLRKYAALDTSVTGLSETRFPTGVLGGTFGGSAVSASLGFSSYAERTFDLVTRDTISIRGEQVAVADRQQSDGSIADVRAALALRLSQRLSIGGAIHILTGSARVTTRRGFENPKLRPLGEVDQLSFQGTGFSAGMMWAAHPRLTLAAAVRSDGTLETTRDSVRGRDIELPKSFSGGAVFAVTRTIRWSNSVTWKSWSDAAADLSAIGAGQAFDVWEFGSGLEIGGGESGSSKPLRLGLRYAQLPFSPTSDQARELDFSFGTSILVASERGIIDFGVERLLRDGAGAEERAWHISFGLTIRP